MQSSLITLTSLKNASYLGVFLFSLEYIGIVPETLVLFAILMVIDVITGVIRVGMVEGGNCIKSKNAGRGVIAKVSLLFMVFSIGITSRVLGYDAADYVQATITVLALGELYSVIGNIHSARTGQPKLEFDAVAFILRKIRDIINKYSV